MLKKENNEFKNVLLSWKIDLQEMIFNPYQTPQ